MKSDDASYQVASVDRRGQFTRRLWLQGVACSLGLSVVGLSAGGDAAVQDSPTAAAIRAMSTMTGGELAEPWVGPTASLVSIILDYSKGLRQLDLGELEPTTVYRPR